MTRPPLRRIRCIKVDSSKQTCEQPRVEFGSVSVIDGYLRRSEGIDDFLDQVVTLLSLFSREDRNVLGLKQLTTPIRNKRRPQSRLEITFTRNADAKVTNTL